MPGVAALATHSQEPVFQTTASQVILKKFVLNVARQFSAPAPPSKRWAYSLAQRQVLDNEFSKQGLIRSRIIKYILNREAQAPMCITLTHQMP